jgi:hypothetical protein
MGARVRKLLFLAAWGCLLSACASTDNNPDKRDTGEKVSTIPWDHPETWESGGGMPGINSNPGGY